MPKCAVLASVRRKMEVFYENNGEKTTIVILVHIDACVNYGHPCICTK